MQYRDEQQRNPADHESRRASHTTGEKRGHSGSLRCGGRTVSNQSTLELHQLDCVVGAHRHLAGFPSGQPRLRNAGDARQLGLTVALSQSQQDRARGARG